MSSADAPATSAASSTLTRVLIGLVAAVFVISVSARALMGSDEASAAPSSAPASSSAFLPGLTPPDGSGAANQGESSGGTLESLLPVLTEASFFALVGFGLGYAAKKLAKLLLIFLALGFLLVQGLGYAEVITVDWSKLVELLNTWILNVKEGQKVTEWLTNSLPTAGALIGGVLLGFRKG